MLMENKTDRLCIFNETEKKEQFKMCMPIYIIFIYDVDGKGIFFFASKYYE